MTFAIVLMISLPVILGLFLLTGRRFRRTGQIGRGYGTAPRQETPGVPGATMDFSEYPCDHDKSSSPSIVEVHGMKVGVEVAEICSGCIEKFLNRYSTRCASCNGPILPGMPVGQAWTGAKHPHTHMSFDCTESGGLYCGRWGQGRLITLHELEPDTFAPGTSHVMAHVLKTGKPYGGSIN